MGQAAVAGPAVPGGLHLQQVGDTTSEATFVGAGDTNQNGPNAQFAKGLSRFHTPHRFTLNGSYRLPFFAGDGPTWSVRSLGGWQLSGVVQARLGHAVQRHRYDRRATSTSTASRESSRPVLLDPSVVGAHVDDPDTAQQLLPRVGVPQR